MPARIRYANAYPLWIPIDRVGNAYDRTAFDAANHDSGWFAQPPDTNFPKG
jgi:hypothetical protein